MKKNTLKFLKIIAYGLLVPLIVMLLTNLLLYLSGVTFTPTIVFAYFFLNIIPTIIYFIFCAFYFLAKEKNRKMITFVFSVYIPIAIIGIIIIQDDSDIFDRVFGSLALLIYYWTYYISFFAFRFLFTQISKKNECFAKTDIN